MVMSGDGNGPYSGSHPFYALTRIVIQIVVGHCHARHDAPSGPHHEIIK